LGVEIGDVVGGEDFLWVEVPCQGATFVDVVAMLLA
jgi:hypothetical protein